MPHGRGAGHAIAERGDEPGMFDERW